MSWFRVAAQYVSERYPVRVYLPLSFFLTAGLFHVDPISRKASVFVEVLLLFLALLFPFRLLDDLYSIEEDRLKSPERLLCRLKDLRPFRILLYATAMADVLLLLFLFEYSIAEKYIALFWAFHLWYALSRRIRLRSIQVVFPLLKYPLLVWVLSRGAEIERLWVSQLFIFAAFLIHEFLHDPSYQRRLPWLNRFRILRFLPFLGVLAWFGLGLFS